MSDLKIYINERKTRDKKFAAGYDEGYEQFKVVMITYDKDTEDAGKRNQNCREKDEGLFKPEGGTT